jgi:hypothetical protein
MPHARIDAAALSDFPPETLFVGDAVPIALPRDLDMYALNR